MAKELMNATALGGWDDVPTADRGAIKGSLMLFKQGEYSGADDAETLVPVGVRYGWLWFDETNKAVYRLNQPGQPEITREDCGNLDEKRWKKNQYGERPDPVQAVKLVYFVDPATAAEYTFSTSSVGGIMAVDELILLMRKIKRVAPDAFPVVTRDVANFPNSYGSTTVRPCFKWTRECVYANGDAAPTPDLDAVQLPARKPASEPARGKKTIESDKAKPVETQGGPAFIDDDIPFAPII
jgi:hypothetical protein